MVIPPQSDLSDYLYVEDPTAIESTLWYSVVVDFFAMKVEKKKYDELASLTTNVEDLEILLERFHNGTESLAIAAFLNQRYPDKRFNPIAGKFSMTYPNMIPISLNSGDKRAWVNVSPETFGQICYSYWRNELELEEISSPQNLFKGK